MQDRRRQERSDAALRARARQLFALALETPGGLKVQTIHAFCTQLLHLFPFEANVAARFEVLDEITETQMLGKLSLDVLLQAAEAPDTALGRALAQAVLASADITFQDMVREAIRARDRLTRWVDEAGGVPQAMAQLSQVLGVGPARNRGGCGRGDFQRQPDRQFRMGGGRRDHDGRIDRPTRNRAALFHALATLNGTDLLETYLDIFCTRKRDKTKERIATSAIEKTAPDLCQRLNEERDRVWAAGAAQARHRGARPQRRAVHGRHAVIARFRAEKDRRGLLDYDDLIDKTLDLLKDERAAWVHYKLDRGIHHVLIDEAQDTSPKQWEIVKALVSEFFAGAGRARPPAHHLRGRRREAVDLLLPGRRAARIRGDARPFRAGARTRRARISSPPSSSIRSAPARTCWARSTPCSRAPRPLPGLTADRRRAGARGAAGRGAGPGRNLAARASRRTQGRKAGPRRSTLQTRHQRRGQARAAHRRHGRGLAAARAGRPKDVLVLVRRRGALFEAIIRALKNEGIPVAGADRLVLDRAYRGDGPDGAGRRACCCRRTIWRWRRRSRARCSALTTTSCSSSPGTAKAACATRCERSGPNLPSAVRRDARRPRAT